MQIEPWALETAHKDLRPLGHFFDADTKRYWKSRIGPAWHEDNGGFYFITSERPRTGPRTYRARVMDPDGNINTIGEAHAKRTHALKSLHRARALKLDGHTHVHARMVYNAVRSAKATWEKLNSDVLIPKTRSKLNYEMKELRNAARSIARSLGYRLVFDSIHPSVRPLEGGSCEPWMSWAYRHMAEV